MEFLEDGILRELISNYNGSWGHIICSVQMSLCGNIDRGVTMPMTLFLRPLMPLNFLGLSSGRNISYSKCDTNSLRKR